MRTHTHTLGAGFAPEWHRPWFRYFAPVEGEGGGDQKPGEAKTYTQAELDQIVTDKLNAQASTDFADYDELKQKVAGVQTVEQKLAELAAKQAETETRALRAEIASRHGIAPEDRDLFLTGSDKATLEAQAKRLADREAARNKSGRAPKEGTTTTDEGKDASLREFTRNLFASAQNE